ncbi:hypothetical protein Tco_1153221 [Tanacetum coccineum]
MGSEAIELPALKEDEFAQIIVLGVHVSFPNGKRTIIRVDASFNSLPSRNLPKTNISKDFTRWFPCKTRSRRRCFHIHSERLIWRKPLSYGDLSAKFLRIAFLFYGLLGIIEKDQVSFLLLEMFVSADGTKWFLLAVQVAFLLIMFLLVMFSFLLTDIESADLNYRLVIGLSLGPSLKFHRTLTNWVSALLQPFGPLNMNLTVPPQNGACHPHGVLPMERLMVRQNNISSGWIHEMYCELCSTLEEAQACKQWIQPFPVP